jgi:putative hydrolase of HD superfamily
MDKVLNDIEKGSPHGKEIVGWINEYESGEGIEVKIAHDADQLELLLVLKREQELGNDKTQDWYDNIFKRLETKQGKQLAAKIWETSSDSWWKEIHP